MLLIFDTWSGKIAAASESLAPKNSWQIRSPHHIKVQPRIALRVTEYETLLLKGEGSKEGEANFLENWERR